MQTDLFQFSLENTAEIILLFKADGYIVYANKAAERELDYKDQVCGHMITDIFPEQFEIAENCFLLKHEVEENPQKAMAYRGNRTCFPVKLCFFPFFGEKEERVGKAGPSLYLCTAQDASLEVFLENKASRAGVEAEEALKVKAEFMANITHELRTPVNGILGNIKELQQNETDRDKLHLLYLIERGCKDMNALINNILDFSKLEAGKFVLEPRKFQFRSMIEYVKESHSNQIVEKGLDFSVSVSEEIPEYIVGDELRIVQVLNNLLSNAYKFTSVGGIHVEVIKSMQSGKSMKLFFMVIDTGIGIARQNQDKLFQSFTQVDASITRKYGGTGLGLSISKQLVQLMGGNVYLESEYGKGSIFSFDIWVELPDGCAQGSEETGGAGKEYKSTESFMIDRLYRLTEKENSDKVWQYGESENKEEVKKKLTKLLLCIEMESWEKAETFADTIKQLLEGAPDEISRAAFRMKMAVQKNDYEKARKGCETVSRMLSDGDTEGSYDRSE